MSVMAPIKILNDSLVFYYDTANGKSYLGEPTTNLVRSSNDLTSTVYGSDNEWASTEPTKFTKSYTASIQTPIGYGATFCSETSNTGYYHLSRYGGDSENGLHSISCYIKPTFLFNNFTIGMLGDSGNQVTFDLTNNTITYGGGISNRNAFIASISDYPGWYRIGANIEGRTGGWVGCIGLNTYTSYTPSTPYKSFYIAGTQYEYKNHSTAWTTGSRSATQGLADLTKNTTPNLTNATFDTGSNLNFITGSYISTSTNCGITGDLTMFAFINPQVTFGIHKTVICTDVGYQYGAKLMSYKNSGRYGLWLGFGTSNYEAFTSVNINDGTNKMLAATWTKSTGVVRLYLNGVLTSTISTGITNTNMVLNDGKIYVGTEYRNLSDLPGDSYEGKIYCAGIYNRVLSDSEILQNYNSMRSRFGL